MVRTAISTKKLFGMRVVGGNKRKRIGKVRRFVFHPTERRCIGFTVKRPDAALMFHRKDLFVALDGYDVEDGEIVVRDEVSATDRGAVRALGVDWDSCVIWVGMPVVTKSGDFLGCIDEVVFDRATGEVMSVCAGAGVANDAILGKRKIPGRLVLGFKRGIGEAIGAMGEYNGEDVSEIEETGAILVADEAYDIAVDGGAAAAAGKAAAAIADKARRGTAKAKPAAQKAAKATGEAVEKGTFAVGKQLGRASGMFAAFKEEYEKAAHGDDE